MGRSARSSTLHRETAAKSGKESRLLVMPMGGIRKMIELELSDHEFEQVKTKTVTATAKSEIYVHNFLLLIIYFVNVIFPLRFFFCFYARQRFIAALFA